VQIQVGRLELKQKEPKITEHIDGVEDMGQLVG
jgi:hypothetical protein